MLHASLPFCRLCENSVGHPSWQKVVIAAVRMAAFLLIVTVSRTEAPADYHKHLADFDTMPRQEAHGAVGICLG